MNDDLKKKFNDKLVNLVNHISDLKEDKKTYNASANELINSCSKRATALSMTLKRDDLQCLFHGYNEDEIAGEFGFSLAKMEDDK